MTAYRTAHLLVALSAALSLAACSKAEDERTAGQKLDGVIADARQTGNEIKADTAQVAAEARSTMEGAAADVERTATVAAESAKQSVSDVTIASKIKLALTADDRLKAHEIDVDTRAGQVTLTGRAPDADSKARAATLAAAVEGVRSVDNRLVVDGRV